MNIPIVPTIEKNEIEDAYFSCEPVSEGKAKMYFPHKSTVFYNPVQEFNRDLSVCVINSFIKYKQKLTIPHDYKRRKQIKKEKSSKLHIEEDVDYDDEFNQKLLIQQKPNDKIIIVEALSATGIRSIRYALEIESIYRVISNDIQPHSVKTIMINSVLNGVENKVIPTKMEACLLLTLLRFPIKYRPDVIDIDPYGSPAIFLDSAVQAINEGGLICITATDMAILCGNYPESTYSKYGSLSMKSTFCHEMALRILLFSVDNVANRYKRYIVPLLSVSVDFYIRVFIQVFTSPSHVKYAVSKKSYVNICTTCNNFSLFPLAEQNKKNSYQAPHMPIGMNKCTICTGSCRLAGPVWSDPIQKLEFLDSCKEELKSRRSQLNTSRRIEGILQVVSEEINHIPFYYSTDDIFSLVRSCTPPSTLLRSALIRLGYRISLTHCKRSGFKTDAPPTVVWDIVRAWVAQSENKSTLASESPGFYILSTPLTHIIDFSPLSAADPLSITDHYLRFQINPQPNWGPMKRPKNPLPDENEEIGPDC